MFTVASPHALFTGRISHRLTLSSCTANNPGDISASTFRQLAHRETPRLKHLQTSTFEEKRRQLVRYLKALTCYEMIVLLPRPHLHGFETLRFRSQQLTYRSSTLPAHRFHLLTQQCTGSAAFAGPLTNAILSPFHEAHILGSFAVRFGLLLRP